MIKALRAQLIPAAMFSLLVVLPVILGVNLLGSYRKVVSDADRVVDLLAAKDGAFPPSRRIQLEDEGPRRRSPELAYETRYFSVLLDEDGHVAATDIGQIAAVDAEPATDYAQQVPVRGIPPDFSRTTGF